MKIATIMFAYARSEHTRLTLEALRLNTERPHKLYIFQDGKKETTDWEEWNKVNALISSINWCENEVIVSEVNRGLADSIMKGINYVSNLYDAFIVLEDDCVTHPLFLAYMNEALGKYQYDPKIFCINGSFRNSKVKDNGSDAYFTGRASSWGWGTWIDRWKSFSADYRVLGRIKKDKSKNKQLMIWGKDLEGMLLQNVYGYVDSWAVLWALHIIDKKGYCLTPYKSLVNNIGNDGSGVNCENTYIDLNVRDKEDLNDFTFPNSVQFPDNYEEAFKNYWSWTSMVVKYDIYNAILANIAILKIKGCSIAKFLLENNIKEVAIWGRGRVCDVLISEIEDCINVQCIIESISQGGTYHGYPVKGIKDIDARNLYIIVIPIYDYGKICDLVNRENRGIIRIDHLIESIIRKEEKYEVQGQTLYKYWKEDIK